LDARLPTGWYVTSTTTPTKIQVRIIDDWRPDPAARICGGRVMGQRHWLSLRRQHGPVIWFAVAG